MPDLRELRVFVAVAESLNFTRAAERLHLAQQSVSKTIRDLEDELGVELLERTSRAVALTAAGEALLGPARETLAQAESAFAVARAVGGGMTGTVTVGFTPAIGPIRRSEVVEAVRADTDQSVSLRDLRPGELQESLRDRDVDIAVASAAGTTAAGLDRAPLRPSPMQIHVPVDHPLADAGSVTLDQFDGERLLTASSAGTPYTDLLLERFAEAGADLTAVPSRVIGGGLLLNDLAKLDAIAAMPAGTAPSDGVRILEAPGFTMPMLLLWPAGRPTDAVRRLLERLGDPPS